MLTNSWISLSYWNYYEDFTNAHYSHPCSTPPATPHSRIGGDRMKQMKILAVYVGLRLVGGRWWMVTGKEMSHGFARQEMVGYVWFDPFWNCLLNSVNTAAKVHMNIDGHSCELTCLDISWWKVFKLVWFL